VPNHEPSERLQIKYFFELNKVFCFYEMTEAVDPRFARWFGRQVVMHARADEDLFVQQVRKKELEKWERVKTAVKKFAFDIVPYTLSTLFQTACKVALFLAAMFNLITWFCLQTFLMFVFMFLPLLLFLPLLSLSCKYGGNQTAGVCNADNYNWSLPVQLNGKQEFIMIDASLIYYGQEFLRLFGDILDWILWNWSFNPKFSVYPDKATLCAQLEKYYLFGGALT